MTNKERLELARWAAKKAKESGADDAAVDVSQNRDIEIDFRDGKIDQLNESTRNSLSVSIYANKRFSSNSTNDLRKESVETFIDGVVATTKFLGEDEFRSLPDPKYYKGQKEID